MSRQVRNRVTATALGVFLLGAALLTTGTANAEQVAGGGRQVVFAGSGVLGLACRSTPSVESMTIPAEGTVRLVNRTGHTSRLRLDGESMGTIPDDSSTEVVFRRGTTAVTLDPTCAITDPATPVLVTASPRVTTWPDTIPTPADPEPAPDQTMAAPADPETPDEPADSSATLPGPAVPASRPSTTPPKSAKPSTIRPDATTSRLAAHSATTRASRVAAQAATTAVQAMPLGGASPRARIKTPVRGTAGAVVPAFSGMPPGDDRTILPGVPTLDVPSPAETAPALPAGPPSGIVAAEPVAAMRPLPDTQPIGLLAVVATITVAGVAIAVIRAFVSQRAYRAGVALTSRQQAPRGGRSNLIGVVVPPQVPPSECGPGAPRLLTWRASSADGALFGYAPLRRYAGSVRNVTAVGAARGFLLRATQDLLPRRDRGRQAHRR